MSKNIVIFLTILNLTNAQSFLDFFNNSDWKEELYKNKVGAITLIEPKLNGESIGFGSGVNISKKGVIITNYHVVKGADAIQVTFKGGRYAFATHYMFVDEYKDFVILHLMGEDNLPFVELGDSDLIKIGQDVVAIGNPLGQWSSMTKGIISQIIDKGGHKLFQTDVTIAPGSSGGALFNSDKKVIGITTSGMSGININFAIPSNYIKSAQKRASAQTRRWIGFDKPKKIEKKVASTYSNESNPASNTFGEEFAASCCVNYFYYLIILGLIPW